MPNNNAVENHPLVNTRAIFRPYADPIHTWGNSVVIAPGMSVLIKAVFYNWNDVKGLTMYYVYVPSTGKYTHVSPDEMSGEKYGDPVPVEAEPEPVNVFANKDYTDKPTIIRIYVEDLGDEWPWCIDGINIAGEQTDHVDRYRTMAEALFAAPAFVDAYPSLVQDLPDPTD